jgi:parallel beta-helix repeat protein
LNYTKIQEAIDAPETSDGHTIFVEKGVYYEHIVVNKSLSLIGENKSNTIVEKNNTVIACMHDNVTIRGFTVKHGSTGIYVDHSKASLVAENNVTNNVDGILVRFSDNCTIYRNFVGNNTNRGTLITNSWNFTVRDNDVYGNGGYGINANASSNGLIVQNNVYKNYFDGIGLLDSNNCRIAGNLIDNNRFFGIWIDSSTYNSIYHNNIVNNGFQATSNSVLNAWNNSEEGNYWSDYNGIDLDYDGIGDSWYEIDSDNIDHYPLMNMFSSFNTSYGYAVDFVSNSSISDFSFNLSLIDVGPLEAILTFNVSGDSDTDGFLRVCIPKALINGSYVVKFNGEVITNTTYPQVRELPCSNETYEYLYINYTHSKHRIEVSGTTTIPEFPSFLILPLFMIATLLAVIVYKRKHTVRQI